MFRNDPGDNTRRKFHAGGGNEGDIGGIIAMTLFFGGFQFPSLKRDVWQNTFSFGLVKSLFDHRHQFLAHISFSLATLPRGGSAPLI